MPIRFFWEKKSKPILADLQKRLDSGDRTLIGDMVVSPDLCRLLCNANVENIAKILALTDDPIKFISRVIKKFPSKFPSDERGEFLFYARNHIKVKHPTLIEKFNKSGVRTFLIFFKSYKSYADAFEKIYNRLAKSPHPKKTAQTKAATIAETTSGDQTTQGSKTSAISAENDAEIQRLKEKITALETHLASLRERSQANVPHLSAASVDQSHEVELPIFMGAPPPPPPPLPSLEGNVGALNRPKVDTAMLSLYNKHLDSKVKTTLDRNLAEIAKEDGSLEKNLLSEQRKVQEAFGKVIDAIIKQHPENKPISQSQLNKDKIKSLLEAFITEKQVHVLFKNEIYLKLDSVFIPAIMNAVVSAAKPVVAQTADTRPNLGQQNFSKGREALKKVTPPDQREKRDFSGTGRIASVAQLQEGLNKLKKPSSQRMFRDNESGTNVSDDKNKDTSSDNNKPGHPSKS